MSFTGEGTGNTGGFVGTTPPPLWRNFYTPTGTWATNTAYAGEYTISETDAGYVLAARIDVSTSGTPDAGSLEVNYLPPGWELDTDRLPGGALRTLVGYGLLLEGGVGYKGPIYAYLSSPTAVTIAYLSNASTMTAVTRTAPTTIGATDHVQIQLYGVPVARAA